jgi:hypothetical protein
LTRRVGADGVAVKWRRLAALIVVVTLVMWVTRFLYRLLVRGPSHWFDPSVEAAQLQLVLEELAALRGDMEGEERGRARCYSQKGRSKAAVLCLRRLWCAELKAAVQALAQDSGTATADLGGKVCRRLEAGWWRVVLT